MKIRDRRHGMIFLATIPLLFGVFLLWQGCGGGGGGGGEQQVSPPVAGNAYSQADLAATWDVIVFQTGSGAGWAHATVIIDSVGSMTIANNSWQSSSGSTPPAPGSIVYTINGDGVVTKGGPNGNATYQGHMSGDKQLIVATETIDSTTKGMNVYRKRVSGVTYGNSDLASISFAHHGLNGGSDNTWEYGSGLTDGSGVISLNASFGPAGQISLPQPNFGTFQVDSAGIVTVAGGNTFHGLLTPDKKVIFTIDTIDTGSTKYQFLVIMVTGQTFTQADYAQVGSPFLLLRRNFWSRGTTSVDSTGAGTFLTYSDSLGVSTLPANFSRTLSASGAIDDPADTTDHGQLSFGKNITVRTSTTGTGNHGIVIGIKR